MRGLPQKQNARRAYKIRLCGHLRRYKKIVKKTYIIYLNSNTFYIPLRNNLGPEIRKYGRIGHSLPSPSRPNAGLDFRYALVINSLDYIEPQTIQKIPNSQYNKLQDDISDIEKEFKTYLMGFIKAIKKNRIHREPLFRESSLINFVSELNDSHL